MNAISSWMTQAVRSGSWKRHDDLHLDSIVGNRHKDDWITEFLKLVPDITAARDAIAPAFAVVLGFGLRTSARRLQPKWHDQVALARDLGDSPPSIYMYERDTPEWTALLSDNEAIGQLAFLPVARDIRYRQVWDQEYQLFLRSLLVEL